MSKQEEAGLILNLYNLRREETMRKARDWYFRDFNPQSFADFNAAIFGENSAYLRMVISYWEMAAALVKNGAVSLELFSDSNGEHIGVFSKIEPLLGEIAAPRRNPSSAWTTIRRQLRKAHRRHTGRPQARRRSPRANEGHPCPNGPGRPKTRQVRVKHPVTKNPSRPEAPERRPPPGASCCFHVRGFTPPSSCFHVAAWL